MTPLLMLYEKEQFNLDIAYSLQIIAQVPGKCYGYYNATYK